jgi:hypothetical protein
MLTAESDLGLALRFKPFYSEIITWNIGQGEI